MDRNLLNYISSNSRAETASGTIPNVITWLHHIRSGSKENFPPTRQETCSSHVHSSNLWIFIFRREGKPERVAAAAAVAAEGWRSVVTLHVPVGSSLHSQLSSHLTGLSVSAADQDASLSLTGWRDSAAIQSDSSSGSCWRKGGLR